MKRLISNCLVALALLIVVASASGYSFNEKSLKANKTSVSDYSTTSSDQSYFSATEFPFDSVANEQIRITTGSHSGFSRLLPDTFMFRIIHSGLLANEHFFSAQFFYTTLFAQKQAGGYYLFYLCKLLI